jgi:hypothetical protein
MAGLGGEKDSSWSCRHEANELVLVEEQVGNCDGMYQADARKSGKLAANDRLLTSGQ